MTQQLGLNRCRGRSFLEIYYDAAFALSLLCCALVGRFPQYSLILSGVMVLCFASSILSDRFFLYMALFMFMRNKMVIGGTTAYRFYSYLLVLRMLMELPRLRLRVGQLPVLLVIALHCLFAGSRVDMRMSMNVLVDCVLIYLVLCRVLQDDRLTRQFLLAFLMGMVLSGIYGFTATDAFRDITVDGRSEEINRNYGSLGDANYAGFYYVMAFFIALELRGLPKWINAAFAGFALILVLRTASLSALLTLAVLLCFWILLRERSRAVPILILLALGSVLVLSMLLSIPAFRRIPQISGLVLRIAEKLRYLQLGRWDMLTTDRYDLWTAALSLFSGKSLAGKLFGGSVITMFLAGTNIRATYWAVHQSYIQALLNFGILGTLAVFLPILAIYFYRLANHMLRPRGYANEDIRIIQLICVTAFLVFGMTVDFFIDWAYLFFLLI